MHARVEQRQHATACVRHMLNQRLAGAFKFWATYARARCTHAAVVQRCLLRMTHRSLAGAFQEWRGNAQEQADDRAVLAMCVQRMQHVRLQAVLTAWQDNARWQAEVRRKVQGSLRSLMASKEVSACCAACPQVCRWLPPPPAARCRAGTGGRQCARHRGRNCQPSTWTLLSSCCCPLVLCAKGPHPIRSQGPCTEGWLGVNPGSPRSGSQAQPTTPPDM